MTRARMTLAVMAVAIAPLALTSALPPTPRFIWNATASAPVGLYRVGPPMAAKRGDLVAARPPGPLADWLAEGGHLPLGVPLVKRIAAGAGQRVCRSGVALTVDGRLVARARSRDRQGRRLPVWSGCRRLESDELLLLNDGPESLDGRYFGISRRTDLLGRLTPLWTREGR